MDLREASVVAANFVNVFLPDRERGILNYEDKIIVFGNDCYVTDIFSEVAVELFRWKISELGIEEEALGTSNDGVSWAMIIWKESLNGVEIGTLEQYLWECWMLANEEDQEDDCAVIV